MVTRDHHALARALTQKLNISKWKKAAFALGNIEPDYNRISYMGHRSEYFSNGHSYQCRKKWIFSFMEKPYRNTLLWWYGRERRSTIWRILFPGPTIRSLAILPGSM